MTGTHGRPASARAAPPRTGRCAWCAPSAPRCRTDSPGPRRLPAGSPSFDSVTDAPENAGRIDQREVSDAPGTILRWPEARSEALHDSRSDDMPVPVVRVLDQQAHHEIVGMVGDIELLQQKARVAVTHVGETAA